ncbi:ADP-forming succinate--CoA ligase subunit beta [Desulfoluna sp.]|uniref:ADP-forming succinate--CoA ligase subunit beta n=1 Tax=Desulfoluna sp. TaxID=2045199 RepID=UPI00260449F1|nr:ADP-forming succinate--CoA ligase subunit beta [Desulfoluna sp.]
MKIHEYQAKELFRTHGISVPEGVVARTPGEAAFRAVSMKGWPVAVKAQIHAGGRGKAGGVKLVHSAEEAEAAAEAILGATLVTQQTGPEGKEVNTLLIEEGLDIARELYLGIVPDRKSGDIVIMASLEGGMEIEEVAEKSPEKILKVRLDPLAGLWPSHLRQVVYGLGLEGGAAKSVMALIKKLYEFFVAKDCSLVEINPLVITRDDEAVVLDAKVDFDDNALYRHAEISILRDITEESPLEVEASRHRLNYISLDGNIGNIVNGAGLAMATMDLIKLAGGKPANFLDVGGGATSEMVENAFRILLKDKKVKGVLINIFGGILRCDIFARGVVDAAAKIGMTVPVVVRMEGTNVEDGRRILKESGLDLQTAVDLNDAAEKIAAIVG